MRFKATFTPKGLQVLEKGFLPTFEKFGKSVQVLLGADEVHFIQTSLNTDGAHVVSRFQMEVLFDPDTYKCQSKHHNLIAFNVEVGLLLRVLRAADANNAEVLEVKLSQKELPVQGTENETQAKPFLTFTGRGDTLSIVQELPISKPYTAADIDKLVEGKEVNALCPYYVDLQPCTAMLQSMVDRMKSVADTISFATCKNGDVYVSVRAINLLLGTQARELNVYPQAVASESAVDRSLPAEQQLDQALQAEEASTVAVQQKHLSRALTVTQLTVPSQILCGIAGSLAYIHLMFVFKDPSNPSERFDDSVHLSFRLPVKDA